jgi:hypothetical protein
LNIRHQNEVVVNTVHFFVGEGETSGIHLNKLTNSIQMAFSDDGPNWRMVDSGF